MSIPLSPAAEAALRSLELDRQAAVVVRSLTDCGVPSRSYLV